MRSASLLLVAVLLAAPLSAQSNPMTAGTWALGGSTRLALHTGGGRPTAWGLAFAPSLGRFLLPGVAVGATARGSYYTFGTGSKHMWAVGPSVTWYPAYAGKLSPYLSTSAEYGWYAETVGDSRATHAGELEWRIGAGVHLRAGRTVGLQLGADYGPSRFRFDEAARAHQAVTRQVRPAVALQVYF